MVQSSGVQEPFEDSGAAAQCLPLASCTCAGLLRLFHQVVPNEEGLPILVKAEVALSQTGQLTAQN
jgi:hypothetical protein